MEKAVRRKYTDEFKEGAVKLVTDQGCVFRSKSATNSGRIRPLIPFHSGRAFRWKAATDSGGIRPPC